MEGRPSGKEAICKAEQGVSGETNPFDSWVLDFQPPELGCPLIQGKPTGLWCFVLTDSADGQSGGETQTDNGTYQTLPVCLL